jgi:hypothetical protein
MNGPLAFSPTPFRIDLGAVGKTYITGVLSGLGFEQSSTAFAEGSTHAGPSANSKLPRRCWNDWLNTSRVEDDDWALSVARDLVAMFSPAHHAASDPLR